MKKNRLKGTHFFIIVLAMVALIIAILHCRDKISTELQTQINENLHDVASQNVLILEHEIKDKKKLMNSMANELQGIDMDNPDDIIKVLTPFTEAYHFKRIGYIDSQGEAYTTDGFHKSLAFRTFFRQSMLGNEYITGVMIDVLGDPERINVFSVPVYEKDGKTINGVLFATYQTKMFQELIDVNSFNGQGSSYLIKTDGTVITGSMTSSMFHTTDNIFAYFAKDTSKNANVSRQIRNDIFHGKSGHASFWHNDEQYVYYLPVQSSIDGQPCYMLTIVPAAVLKTRQSLIFHYLNLMLLSILSILMLSLLFYLYTYRKRRQELLCLAYQDSLTLGDNYACFIEKYENRNINHGFIISMDLIEFKIINNTCGIETGDETLRSIWNILCRILHPAEFAARINADHFILYLEAEEKDQVIPRLEQITKEVCRLSEELNIPRMSPYFGVYQIEETAPVEVNYSRANEAKHLVKGRNDTNYAFYDEVDFQKIVSDKELEDSFETALKECQFEIWYQPKYSTEGESIVGAEALTRWRKPDGTLVPPYRFIPLFEKNGMISQLDEYVFRTVCAQQKQWEAQGHSILPVSINISRASLYYSNVVAKYKTILEESQVEPQYVPLEITESATINNTEISELIDSFHAAGFPLLLDDFGNGYSSLATLNVMPFDTLKLDKSLIDYIGDPKGEKLLYYTIKLARSLGMHITAEGVEEKEQVTFLKRVHCHDIQGYYYSKPLPLADFQQLLFPIQGTTI